MGMKTAEMIVNRYQTSCPRKIAEYLHIDVQYRDLPELVRGFYVSTQPTAIIVLNWNLSEARQKFCLAYGIGIHLKEHRNVLFAYTDPSDVLLMPLVFAANLLGMNGEYGTKNIAEYYLEHESPSHLVLPLCEQLLQVQSAS